MWSYLIFVDFVLIYNMTVIINGDLVLSASKKHYLPITTPWKAELAYEVTLGVVLGISTLFVLPLTLLVVVQTMNFLANKTTSNRMNSKQVSDLGIAIQEISGKKYA